MGTTRITLSPKGARKAATETGKAVLTTQAQRAADSSGNRVEFVSAGGAVLAFAEPSAVAVEAR